MEDTNAKQNVREVADYYEFLQISPHAGSETIHRIYRYLAARYHPDNPDTGDSEAFCMLRTAYEVLSDPARRAQYDAHRSDSVPVFGVPLSSTIDFMDEVDGEQNRRLALLAMLYARRRTNPRCPEVSLMDLEISMGFPRDYLDFTTWYLVQKGYMTRADNSDFTITVAGVDYVETQRRQRPILNHLLTNGKLRLTEFHVEQRVNSDDRRMGLPDTRSMKSERRVNGTDRRTKKTALRTGTYNVH